MADSADVGAAAAGGGAAGGAPSPEAPKMPWLLIAGILGAAWWWEKKFKGKSVSGAIADTLLGSGDDDDEEDDDDDEDQSSDVDWTDEPVGKGRSGRKALSDIGGPVSDTYIKPIKLAVRGDCSEAVALLDKQSRRGLIEGQKKQVVRRALRRAAKIVTEKCPKAVEDLVEDYETIEYETGMQLPSTGRRSIPTREDFMIPGPGGGRSFDPLTPLTVQRTRGEAGRFKRTRGAEQTEHRREGPAAWRILDLHTGKVSRKRVPTGKPRGRPKKLQ